MDNNGGPHNFVVSITMSKERMTLEKKVFDLATSLEDSLKFLSKLETKKSDLVFDIKIRDENIRTLKKRAKAVMADEFYKIMKENKLAASTLEKVELEIFAMKKAVDRIEKQLKIAKNDLDFLKETEKPKVLPFKRKNEK